MNCRLLRKCRRKEFTMKNFTVNHANKTIVTTAALRKDLNLFDDAGKGEAARRILKELREVYPEYKIVSRSHSNKKSIRTTKEDMKLYIENQRPELKAEFEHLMAQEYLDKSGKVSNTVKFLKIRDWFTKACAEYNPMEARTGKQQMETELEQIKTATAQVA